MIEELRKGWHRFWALSWWWKVPILGIVAFLTLGIGLAAAGLGDDDGQTAVGEATQSLTATVTLTATSVASPTETPAATPSPTTKPTPVSTPTPIPTPRPTATPVPPTPAPTVAPQLFCQTQAPANPYGFDFCFGDLIYSPPGDICSYIACIGNFWNGVGYVIQCKDGMFSKSGGRSGSCSYHGGNLRPLYSH